MLTSFPTYSLYQLSYTCNFLNCITLPFRILFSQFIYCYSIAYSVRRVGFHLYMAVSTLQLTSIRNLSEYWQLLRGHTSRCRSIFGFHILLSDTAVESCVTFKPERHPYSSFNFQGLIIKSFVSIHFCTYFDLMPLYPRYC